MDMLNKSSRYTDEHMPEDALSKAQTVFDCKERRQDHQCEDLAGSELAVRRIGKAHLPVVKSERRHYGHDSLDRLRIVTFSK